MNNINYEKLVNFNQAIGESDDLVISKMKKYLEECRTIGADIHQAVEPVNGDTLLHISVRRGDFRIIKALLACGAQPNLKNLGGKSAKILSKNKDEGIQKLFEYSTNDTDLKNSLDLFDKLIGGWTLQEDKEMRSK